MFVGCHVDDGLRGSIDKFGKCKSLLERWKGGGLSSVIHLQSETDKFRGFVGGQRSIRKEPP